MSAQPAQPAQAQTVPQDRSDANERAIRLLTTRGRVREWTPQSIQRQSVDMVMLALTIVDEDNPELTARILPRGMPIENFHNMLLREMDRRHAFGQYIYTATVPPRPGETFPAPNDLLENVLRFIRPQISLEGNNISLGANQSTNITPGDAALYDAAITSFFWERYTPTDNTKPPIGVDERGQPIYPFRTAADGRPQYPQLTLDNDVIGALNLPPAAPGRAYTSRPLTDVGRRTLGYAFGSIDPLNPRHSNGPLLVQLTAGVSGDELQQTFCPVVRDMYRAGDQQNPRDAFSSGFIQGRVNDRTPENTDPAIGITGPCPPPATPVMQRPERPRVIG